MSAAELRLFRLCAEDDRAGGAAAAGKGDAGQSGYRAAGAGAGEQAASGKGKGRDTEPIRYAGAGGAGTGGGGGPFGNTDHHRRGGNGGGTAPAGRGGGAAHYLPANAAPGMETGVPCGGMRIELHGKWM